MLVPKLPSFFKRPVNQQFDYKPLYYDSVKEKQEKRAAEIGRHGASSFSGKINFSSSKARAVNRSNWRLLIIIMALFGLAYYIITL
ncbi:MAG TPA: hypothetical protein EYM84_02615 [Flavobacteriales bacterium]|nr:hypothetical protein [Flavobacteriales bacterium]